MTIISICIWTSHDISRQLNYSILGRRSLKWMKKPLEKPLQDTAGFCKKPLQDTAGFEIRTMAIRGRTRYVSVTETPHKTHSLRMDGGETLDFYESRISVGSVCCSASHVWHADATWPTLNQYRFMSCDCWVWVDELHGVCCTSFPANTRRWTNAGLMLAQRRRRWANITPALAQRLVSHGFAPRWSHAHESGYLT